MSTTRHNRSAFNTGGEQMHDQRVNRRFQLLLFLLLTVTIYSPALPLRAAEAPYPKTIIDSHGKSIEVAAPFTRIISLYSAHTENLCRMGASGQLVGISRSDDYPEHILTKQKYSYREDAERFIGSHPDLVLVRPMIERSYPQFIEKLRLAGITVISIQPTNIEQMLEYWRVLGVLSGHETEALAMAENFKKGISRFQKQLSNIPKEKLPKVYFEAIHKKMKTFADNSIAMFVLENAGGINIANDASRVRTTNIAYFGKEKLLSRGESIDIFLSQHGRMNPVSVEIIKNEPGFGAIRAVREDKVFLIDEPLVSRPTMRILEGIEKVRSYLFPSATSLQEENS